MKPSRAQATDRNDDLIVTATPDGSHVEHGESGLAFDHSFVTGDLPRRAAQPGQALVRACRGRKRPVSSLLDATAGWGGDSLTLAWHGLDVTMLERQPQLCDVLERALSLLAAGDRAEVAARLRLRRGDVADFLADTHSRRDFDCIYIDPMFPPRSSGAKPGKAMQILQAITANYDIEQVFELALARARRRVVVKRPARAPRLDARVPDIVQREKTVRFDVYLTP